MADLAKWGLLVASAVLFIGIVLSFPFMELIDLDVLSTGISNILGVISYYLTQARGFLNLFVPSGLEWMITGSIFWNIISRFSTWIINLACQVSHYILK